MTAWTFLETLCQAVGCHGRRSRRPGLDCCWGSIGERRNWLLSLRRAAAQGCWLLPRSPGSHRQMLRWFFKPGLFKGDLGTPFSSRELKIESLKSEKIGSLQVHAEYLTFSLKKAGNTITSVDMALEVTSRLSGVWESGDGHWCKSRGWSFVDIMILYPATSYAQSLSLWLLWRLIDQCSFQLLLYKHGKAVVPAQGWPNFWEVGNH